MKSRYQVEPRTEHYACMVDLLGQEGKVKEAMDLIKKMSIEADEIVLHDVDEEEKAHSLSYHSEKMAIAYGLLKVPQEMPIWVMKKLRRLLVIANLVLWGSILGKTGFETGIMPSRVNWSNLFLD
ncbi:unnamed protein product [Prunus armeniaca]|nr:unnamed protein product [Prunus armeniaca]